MKKLSSLLLIISIMLICVGCGSSVLGENDVYLSYATGKVTELKNDNLALIEITKTKGGFEKNDKLLVEFDKVFIENENGDAATDYKVIKNLNINDEITVGLFKTDLSKKDGYDYIKVDYVTIYVDYSVT